MIAIRKGPMLEKFAHMVGDDQDSIVAWVNSYVNSPADWEWLSERGLYESTEKERLASIKAYIEWRLENSLTAKIKREIANA